MPGEPGFSMHKNIKIYTLSTCIHCKKAKELLNECAVSYAFTDVDLLQGEEQAAVIDEVKKFNPECSFPTIIIDDEIIVGFEETQIRQALGR